MLSISQRFTSIVTRIALSSPRTNGQLCGLHTTLSQHCNHAAPSTEEEQGGEPQPTTAADLKREKNDRSQIIPVETSIKYLNSAAYKETYGTQYVWEQYRRNHKGLYPSKKTRKTCVRQGAISTGNPCPICRDEYLVLDHRNIELLRQFISPHTGKVLSYSKTGLCQRRHFDLLVAVERAMDYGLLTFDVPFREYDYSEYYDRDNQKVAKTQA